MEETHGLKKMWWLKAFRMVRIRGKVGGARFANIS